MHEDWEVKMGVLQCREGYSLTLMDYLGLSPITYLELRDGGGICVFLPNFPAHTQGELSAMFAKFKTEMLPNAHNIFFQYIAFLINLWLLNTQLLPHLQIHFSHSHVNLPS